MEMEENSWLYKFLKKNTLYFLSSLPNFKSFIDVVDEMIGKT